MRIWDVAPSVLCRSHLLGEHRELHAVWSVIVGNKVGYARHPETRRWRGKLSALFLRHEALVAEMQRCGYRHASALDPALATGLTIQDEYVNTPEEQRAILRAKGCGCAVLDVSSRDSTQRDLGSTSHYEWSVNGDSPVRPA